MRLHPLSMMLSSESAILSNNDSEDEQAVRTRHLEEASVEFKDRLLCDWVRFSTSYTPILAELLVDEQLDTHPRTIFVLVKLQVGLRVHLR